ncbi:hypothetical protein ACFVH6_15115 [Spirillospora sp. NPDC127200]
MPYSEQKLREVLAEHGDGPSPRGDLAARAEAGGRRVRRRRRAAVMAATACAVAAAVIAPQALPEQGPSHRAASRTSRLDVSVFREHYTVRRATAPSSPADLTVQSMRVVTGTVTGFSTRSLSVNEYPGSSPGKIVMHVRIDWALKGPEEPGGAVALGTGLDAPLETVRRSVPLGTKVLAFLNPAQGAGDNPLRDASGRQLWYFGSQGLVFGDENGRAVGAVTELPDREWSLSRMVLDLAPTVAQPSPCPIRVKPKEDRGDALAGLGCAELTPAQRAKVMRVCPGVHGERGEYRARNLADVLAGLKCISKALADGPRP